MEPPTSAPTAKPTDATVPTVTPTMKPTGYKTDQEATAQLQVNMLKSVNFIDKATRATFIEFTVYNANADLFVMVRLCVETTSAGTVIPSYHVMPARLLNTYRVFAGDGVKPIAVRYVVYEFILYVLVILYILVEIKEARAERKLYLEGRGPGYLVGWNIVDVVNLSLFLYVIVLRVLALYTVVDLQVACISLNDINTINSVNAIICFIKIFKYLD